jgi:hypothetical protein
VFTDGLRNSRLRATCSEQQPRYHQSDMSCFPAHTILRRTTILKCLNILLER